MADSPRKETPPPADSAPKILRFLVRVWGVVAGLCKYNCINLCINLFDVFFCYNHYTIWLYFIFNYVV